MKRLSLVIVSAGTLFALSGYAAERVITNDDLERKYPTETQPDPEAWKRYNERSEREYCDQLRQDVAEARLEAYHADKETRKEKIAEYDKLYAEHYERCVKR